MYDSCFLDWNVIALLAELTESPLYGRPNPVSKCFWGNILQVWCEVCLNQPRTSVYHSEWYGCILSLTWRETVLITNTYLQYLMTSDLTNITQQGLCLISLKLHWAPSISVHSFRCIVGWFVQIYLFENVEKASPWTINQLMPFHRDLKHHMPVDLESFQYPFQNKPSSSVCLSSLTAHSCLWNILHKFIILDWAVFCVPDCSSL